MVSSIPLAAERRGDDRPAAPSVVAMTRPGGHQLFLALLLHIVRTMMQPRKLKSIPWRRHM